MANASSAPPSRPESGAPSHASSKRKKSEEPASALERFFAAARSGDHIHVRLALERAEVDPNERLGRFKSTALHEAATAGKHEVVKELLGAFAQIDAKTASGMTPLMKAARFGYVQIVRTLLGGGAGQSGASLQAADENGMTATHHACHSGQVSTAHVLIHPWRHELWLERQVELNEEDEEERKKVEAERIAKIVQRIQKTLSRRCVSRMRTPFGHLELSKSPDLIKTLVTHLAYQIEYYKQHSQSSQLQAITREVLADLITRGYLVYTGEKKSSTKHTEQLRKLYVAGRDFDMKAFFPLLIACNESKAE